MGYYKLNAFQRIRAHILSKTRYMLRPPLSLTCHINTPNKPPDIDWTYFPLHAVGGIY